LGGRLVRGLLLCDGKEERNWGGRRRKRRKRRMRRRKERAYEAIRKQSNYSLATKNKKRMISPKVNVPAQETLFWCRGKEGPHAPAERMGWGEEGGTRAARTSNKHPPPPTT
jgi:hypothetical protein